LLSPSPPHPLASLDPPPPDLSTLSLHDALPISREQDARLAAQCSISAICSAATAGEMRPAATSASIFFTLARIAASERSRAIIRDRKSTRLNSSHVSNSYAVFCLKKKNGHESQA